MLKPAMQIVIQFVEKKKNEIQESINNPSEEDAEVIEYTLDEIRESIVSSVNESLNE